MWTVYRIDKHSTYNNSHAVCRDETWEVVKVEEEFETKEEAESYIITQNMLHCAYDLGLYGCLKDETIVRIRCLESPAYLSKRRFFLGRPDIGKIKQQLRSSHVTVFNK